MIEIFSWVFRIEIRAISDFFLNKMDLLVLFSSSILSKKSSVSFTTLISISSSRVTGTIGKNLFSDPDIQKNAQNGVSQNKLPGEQNPTFGF